MNIDYEFFLPALIAFGLSVVLCPIVIPFLRRLKFGQYVRDDGPRSHLKKTGTPTMGGLIILSSILVTSLLYIRRTPEVLPIIFMTLGFGLIGFLDDYLKVVMKQSMGLHPSQKLLAQALLTTIFAYYYLRVLHNKPITEIPILKSQIELPPWMFVVLIFFVVLGTVNGVNFTDGLDGLASGVTAIVAVFFTFASVAIQPEYVPISLAVVGSLLGFLLFNIYPARVFMGDTGSLALGGFVASLAIMLRIPLYVAIVGIVYLIEIISVIAQVFYFRVSHGKRLLKMAPLHHHFELCGKTETQVVFLFCLLTAMFCVLGLAI